MYKPNDLAIYLHWPFCKSKCPYCDFYKELSKNQDQNLIIEEYISAVSRYHELIGSREIKSIFFGGGTPSLIKPDNIERVINHITKLWPCDKNMEVSLEANPNSAYGTMFAELKSAGINRLSLGVQALNEKDLRFLGRTHNLETARNCIKQVVNTYSNHSIDLIYARPNQTLSSWQQELTEICTYGLKHISLYQLTIEEGTTFARKGIKPLADEQSAELYDFTRDFVADFGYKLYEVSNFAQDGYQSRHNLTYWDGGDYIGIGKSAHGRLTLNNQFLATEYPFIQENLTTAERAQELILMGLRLTSGLNKKRFSQIIGASLENFINLNALANLKELNLITETDDSLIATRTGFLVLNTIIEQLCC